jgi:hypothetical protein
VGDLEPTTTYEFQVRAANAVGVSGWSASVTATTDEPPEWWDDGFAYRTPLNVTTGPTPPINRYAGYSVQTTLDTAGLADAGKLRGDCNDARIARWSGGTWTELDRHVVDCGSAEAEIWFRLQDDIADSSSDGSYWLYYGDPTAESGPEDRNEVYLYWDDFEGRPVDQTPPGWTVQGGGPWHVVDDGGHRILRRKSGGVSGRQVIYVTGLEERDVLTQTRLRTAAAASERNLGLLHRGGGTGQSDLTGYRISLRDDGATSREQSSFVNGSWSFINNPAYAWSTATWHTVTGATFESTIKQWVDGVLLDTETSTDVTSSGRAGLMAWQGADVNYDFDDFMARRYIEPEPTVTLGSEEEGTPPATPADLAATSGQHGQVPVSWNPVDRADSYDVRHREEGSASWTETTGMTDTSHIVTGLDNGVTYEFAVQAVNVHGASGWSTGVTATPEGGTEPPTTPTDLVATSGEDTVVSLSWDAVTGADSYDVRHRAQGTWSWTQTTGITATSHIVTGLDNGVTYEFAVRAVNAGGVSIWSTNVTAAPEPAHDPVWWDDSYDHRVPLTVTAGPIPPVNRYDGYSVRATVDTAGLIDDDTLRGDCNDARIARWADGAWTELDRHIVDCGSANAQIWFALQDDIADAASDDTYWLYHDSPDASAGPTDRNSIYLFHDDFEAHPVDDTPAGWTVMEGGTWHVVAEGGTKFLRRKVGTGGTYHLIRVDGLTERDVRVQARVRLVRSGSAMEISCPLARLTGSGLFDARFYGGCLRKDGDSTSDRRLQILRVTDTAQQSIVTTQSNFWANTWYTIGFASFGNTHRQWRDGSLIHSGTDGGHTASGTVGAISATADRNYDYDDFMARRYTEPEPAVGLGGPEAR